MSPYYTAASTALFAFRDLVNGSTWLLGSLFSGASEVESGGASDAHESRAVPGRQALDMTVAAHLSFRWHTFGEVKRGGSTWKEE